MSSWNRSATPAAMRSVSLLMCVTPKLMSLSWKRSSTSGAGSTFSWPTREVSDQSRYATGDPDHWRAVIETNLLGIIYAAHAVLPAMINQGSGHVIIMSSVSGRESYVGASRPTSPPSGARSALRTHCDSSSWKRDSRDHRGAWSRRHAPHPRQPQDPAVARTMCAAHGPDSPPSFLPTSSPNTSRSAR